jgi:predicted nuclease of predicted toxin-antitoxin system
MKFLADVNVEKSLVDYLVGAGYDVKWIPEYDCRMGDEALLELARSEQRVIITNDKDFGEFFFLQKKIAAGIILFRTHGLSSKRKVGLLGKLLHHHPDRIEGRFVVITEKAFRFSVLEDLP